MKKHFLKNTLLFSLATFISRILGYLRDATIAFIFGANFLTDAFFVAWRIPNTLRQLVAEGSFNAAFIPIFTDLMKKNKSYALAYSGALFSFYTLTLSAITVVFIIFPEFIVGVIAPGLKDKGSIDVAADLLRIVFPYLVLVGWVSFSMALLNTKDRFFVPAVSPALLNLSFIVCAFLLSEQFGIYSLAYGALIGGILQVLIQIPFLLKEGLFPAFSFRFLPEIRETMRRLLPAFASFGVSQFGFIVDTIIASFLMGGAISYLYYANRIFQLPIGLFAVGLGNALLVSLSKHYSEKDEKSFSRDLNTGIRFAIFISVPATAGMMVLGQEIISVLLERGAFSRDDVVNTFYALVGYSAGLTGYALTRPFKSAFFSVGDTKTPLISTIVGVFVSIVFAVIFGFILNWGVFGLAFASSLGGIVSFVYLYAVSKFYIEKKDSLLTFAKSVLSSTVMIAAVFSLKLFVNNLYLYLFSGIVLGSFVYFLTAYLLKESTVLFFINRIKKSFIR